MGIVQELFLRRAAVNCVVWFLRDTITEGLFVRELSSGQEETAANPGFGEAAVPGRVSLLLVRPYFFLVFTCCVSVVFGWLCVYFGVTKRPLTELRFTVFFPKSSESSFLSHVKRPSARSFAIPTVPAGKLEIKKKHNILGRKGERASRCCGMSVDVGGKKLHLIRCMPHFADVDVLKSGCSRAELASLPNRETGSVAHPFA